MKKKRTTNLTFYERVQQYVLRYPVSVILLIVLLVNSNTLFNDYNLDDELVTRNHRLTSKGISAIGDILKEPYYKDAMGYAYEYRPIVLISFALEHEIFGEKPFVSHTINLFLYFVLIAVIYTALQSLFRGVSLYVAFIATLLYALHPIHTEVVASIKCRDELLAFIFGITSLIFALKFTDSAKWYWLLLSVLAVFIGCLSKQSVLTFAVLVPVALVLNRNISFLQLTLVSVLFLAVVFPIMSVGRSDLKVLFVIAALVFIFSLYWIKNINYRRIIAAIKGINFRGLTDKVPTNNISDNTLESKLRLLKQDILSIDIKLLIIPAILSVIIVVLLNIVTSNIMKFLLGACYVVALVSFYKRNLLLYTFPFIIFILCHFTNSNPEFENIQNLTGILLLVMVIAANNATDILLSLVLYVALYVLQYFKSNTFNPQSIFYVPFFVLVWKKRVRYTVAVCIVLLVAMMLEKFIHFFKGEIQLFEVVEGQVSAGILLLSAILIHKSLYRTTYFLIFTLLFILLLNTSKLNFFHGNAISVSKATTAVVATTQKATVSILPQEVDRPLHYVEVPVTGKDKPEVRLGTSFYVLLKYLQLVVVPYPMAFYYGYAEITPTKITEPLALLSVVLHLVLLVLAFAFMRSISLLSFGLFFYLISISIFSSYFVYMPGMMADRNLFIPSLGYCVILTFGLVYFSKSDIKIFDLFKLSNRWKYSILLFLLVYSGLTFARNFDWKDDLTLFRRDIKYVDKSSQAHNLLALHLMQHASKETDPAIQQQLANEALLHFKRALEIYPPFFNVAYDIGRVYMFLNKPDSAIIAFENAITIDSVTLPSLYMQLVELYFNAGNKNKVIEHLENYIRLNKRDYGGYSRLSYIYFKDNKFVESIKVNKEAIEHIPSLVDPYINIAYAFREMKNIDSALYYLRLAEKIDPLNANVQKGIKELSGALSGGVQR